MAFMVLKKSGSQRWDASRPPLSVETDELFEDRPELYARSGLMEKKVMTRTGIIWAPRFAALEQDRLAFTKPGDKDVIDFIRLHEIAYVDIQECAETEEEEGAQVTPNQRDAPPTPTARTNSAKSRTVSGAGAAEDDAAKTVELAIRLEARIVVNRMLRRDAEMWVADLKVAIKNSQRRHRQKALKEEHGHSTLSMFRARSAAVAESFPFQFTFACCICVGFLIDIGEAQFLPQEGSSLFDLFFYLDIIITSLFGFELCFYIFAASDDMWGFWMDPSHLFDAFIVFISITSLIMIAVGSKMPSLKMFRLIRIVRVVRLFKRFESLNRLVHAITMSAVPVLHSFIILLIFTSIFASLATHLFREESPHYFADFATSLYTMFQVVSADSWSSNIARGLFHEDGTLKYDVAIFFFSYYFMAAVVLLNVVVAVLLDKFVDAVQKSKQEAEALEEVERQSRRFKGILDPITEFLASFDDDEDLLERIDKLYTRMDVDHSEGLNYEEFKEGVKRVPGAGAVHLTRDEFEVLTENGRYLNAQGEFDRSQFRSIMKGELWRYSRRELANIIEFSNGVEFPSTILFLKMFEGRVANDLCSLNSRLDALHGAVSRGLHIPLGREAGEGEGEGGAGSTRDGVAFDFVEGGHDSGKATDRAVKKEAEGKGEAGTDSVMDAIRVLARDVKQQHLMIERHILAQGRIIELQNQRLLDVEAALGPAPTTSHSKSHLNGNTRAGMVDKTMGLGENGRNGVSVCAAQRQRPSETGVLPPLEGGERVMFNRSLLEDVGLAPAQSGVGTISAAADSAAQAHDGQMVEQLSFPSLRERFSSISRMRGSMSSPFTSIGMGSNQRAGMGSNLRPDLPTANSDSSHNQFSTRTHMPMEPLSASQAQEHRENSKTPQV